MGDIERGARRHGYAGATPRRVVLQGAAGLAVAWMTPLAAQDPRTARPMAGDRLAKIDDETATPLTPADIPQMSTPILAWPVTPDGVPRSGSRLNRIALVRLDVAALTVRTRSHAADGVVAYSAVCTHTGCEVGAFLGDEHALYCDCHESKFDPRDHGRVIDGPAPRSLPALPLAMSDGRIIVAAPFTSRPGFEQG